MVQSTNTQTHFLTLSPQGWSDLMKEWQEPGFRGKQIAEWLFQKKQFDPAVMLNLPGPLRTRLAEQLDWTLPTIINRLDAQDGASKLLLQTPRGVIESVILRYEGRTSLCVSSQVGCKLACSFCQTGKLGFVRHLGTHEILSQFVHAQQIVAPEGRRISHVVFMGMGEPLDNYENVMDAVSRLTSKDAFGLKNKNVTVSTSGMVPKIYDLAHKTKASLAVSLHASNDELRTELMPINRKHNLEDLKKALLYYQEVTDQIITIEYILISQKNCELRHAKELVRFLHGLRTKVNLIPFNAHPGLPYQRPTDLEIRTFQKYLADRSIAAPVRYSKGLEVSGACGQLAAKVASQLQQAPSRKTFVENYIN